MKLWPVGQVRPLRFHHIRHTTASLLIMAGADLPAVQRIMRHTDPRITTEFYAHLAPGYLRNAIDRLAIHPTLPTPPKPPEALPQAAVAAAFAPPVLQSRADRGLSARGNSEKAPAFGDLRLSGIAGSNRRHSAWEADALPTELIPRATDCMSRFSCDVKGLRTLRPRLGSVPFVRRLCDRTGGHPAKIFGALRVDLPEQCWSR
jgi:hypothetical protein